MQLTRRVHGGARRRHSIRSSTLEAIAAERCTSLYGVPTMFIAQLAHPRFNEFDLSSLRTGIMAGSPCPVEVMKQVQSLMHMPEVTICYGMTETSPVSTQSSWNDPLDRRVSTVGRVHPHVEIKIVDPESGAIVPRGVPGELCTRGLQRDDRLLGQRGGDARRDRRGGWMHTGDLATADEEGYVNIVGRIKDMIIRGGENVYPREVEEYLYTHPAVLDVQVIGVPSEKYGEEVMAWVKLRPRHDGQRRGARRVLPRTDCDVQDPALLEVRRRVPDDGDRQGAEVQDARDGNRRARTATRRRTENGLSGSDLGSCGADL